MSSEDKKCPGSLNKNLNSSPNSVITMWVKLEGNPDFEKFTVNKNDYPDNPTVHDLKTLLRRRFDELANISEGKIQVFTLSDPGNPQVLSPKTTLESLSITNSTELLVRYPLSDLSIKVNCRFTANKCVNKGECCIPHSSGSFSLLQECVKTEFNEKLENIPTKNLYFEYYEDKILKEQVKNEFHFNSLVNKIKRNDENELIINYFKVQVKDQKPYGDWKMKEISRIYDHAFESSEMIDKFRIEDLPELSAHFSNEELQCFFDDLKRKLYAFQVISSNEATCREYISIFLTWAVNHIRKHIDNTARLAVEIEVNGSHGYGGFGYAIFIRYILALVTEAKVMDMEKGITQNLAQIYSAVEKNQEILGNKRKFDQTGLDNYPEVIFGIVTSGTIWRFIRVSGPLKSLKVEITAEYNSGLISTIEIMNYDYAKEVLCCIARVLQAQVVNGSKRPKID
ncbi:501_t:CDS:2 [Ambispora leptoticha]|uniref:501_t:CDS:1 n=1 Tax=Ambispora leptoticha TaxID=144679 RepID=A0A9N8ZX37_9GLOM|nr:501_t:CDS:2 [Ambispora leptoticha]